VLVDELEQALADLLCIAGADSHRDDASVGGISGISGISGSRVASSGSAAQGYGPPVPGIDHGPAVCGQDDIDALLSDLGM
jgi:hypothetical protein